jgi:alkanesulfonate monooxygenase SsuD/methylene tetrahydromethanopterin reductase-like flavin-dependent oxidoreductase (luciferase family)
MLWGEPRRLHGTCPQSGRHTVNYIQPLDPTHFGGYRRQSLGPSTGHLGKSHCAHWRRGQPKQPRRGECRLAAAAAGDVHDTCLWIELAAATGARGNSTALVGTPDTVAKAMVKYYKLGATSLLIRGYDPRPDAIQFGKTLIPRVRELVSVYDAGTA